jgi:hypothetical protein
VAPNSGCREADALGQLSDGRGAMIEQRARQAVAGATLSRVQPTLRCGARGFHNVIIA